MVFLCGNLIFSACSTQASIALSSCEAELLAGIAAVGETIQMSNILSFLVNEEKLENCPRVILTCIQILRMLKQHGSAVDQVVSNTLIRLCSGFSAC